MCDKVPPVCNICYDETDKFISINENNDQNIGIKGLIERCFTFIDPLIELSEICAKCWIKLESFLEFYEKIREIHVSRNENIELVFVSASNSGYELVKTAHQIPKQVDTPTKLTEENDESIKIKSTEHCQDLNNMDTRWSSYSDAGSEDNGAGDEFISEEPNDNDLIDDYATFDEIDIKESPNLEKELGTNSYHDEDRSMESEYEFNYYSETPTITRVKDSKKRIRNDHLTKKYIKKLKVAKGEERISQSGNIIPAKTFVPQYSCKCRHKCSTKFNVKKQQEIFSKFYSSDWMHNTKYLRENVKESPVETRKVNFYATVSLRKRDFKRTFMLTDNSGVQHQVCRIFLLTCLQITPSRYHNAIKSLSTNPSGKDQRGRGPSSNKTSLNDLEFVKEFIEKFPRFESHYRRSKANKKFLNQNLNIVKMYNDYKSECEFEKRKVLSEHMFRHVFNKDYNYGFKRVKSEVCRTCAEIDLQIEENNISEETEEVLKHKKDDHLSDAKTACDNFEIDITKAKKSDGELQCLRFSIQKSLETPCLSSTVAYYRRPLWTYNLCIYDEVKDAPFMYVWSENIALRGAQEIGSCLIYHMKTYFPSNTKHVILYSDPYKGQNRSIKLVLLLKQFLCGTIHYHNIETIEQKFIDSGHTYNNCDRCISVIEREKKSAANIFVPNHWINTIEQAKKKATFQVTEMNSENFFSSKDLQNLIVDIKTTNVAKEINWPLIRNIINRKNQLFFLNVKQNMHDPEQIIRLNKSNITEEMFIGTNLVHLYKGGRPINIKKYDDLMDTLQYIPSEYHGFYKGLTYDIDYGDDNDYGLASGCSDSDDEDEQIATHDIKVENAYQQKRNDTYVELATPSRGKDNNDTRQKINRKLALK